MKKTALAFTVLTWLVTMTSSPSASAADNWLGTWKLNVAKSTYSPGPVPKGATLTFETTPNGTKLSTELVLASGTTLKRGYTSKLDGAEVPWVGSADADTASAKRIDDNSYQSVSKKDGKVTTTSKVVISADGKTLTITQTGVNQKGETVNNVLIYDRQ